jgi:hypothetical protein
MVLYCRPVAREKVLKTLVSLGAFTREVDLSAGGTAPLRQPKADFGVVFAAADPRENEAARAVVHQVRALLAVLPPDADESCVRPLEPDEVARETSRCPLNREAVLRVAHVARRRAEGRSPEASRPQSIIFGGVSFSPTQPILQRGNRVAGLSPTEFGVLRALVSAKGSIVSKSVLQFELTGGADRASDGYLKTVVLRIRRKVEGVGGDASLLAAIRGSGYVLRA